MTESEFGDEILENTSNDTPTEETEEKNKDSQTQSESHSELSEKIRELTERNARNRELAIQKQERNAKLLEELERSLAESSHTRSWFAENAAESRVAPSLPTEDVASKEPVVEVITPETDTPIEKPEDEAALETVESQTEATPTKLRDESVEQPKETAKPVKNKTGLKIVLNLLFYVIVIVVLASVFMSAMEHILNDPFEIMGYTIQRVDSENIEHNYFIEHNYLENTLIITSNGLNEVAFSSYSWGRILAFFENSLTFKILVAGILLIVLSAGKEFLIDKFSPTSLEPELDGS